MPFVPRLGRKAPTPPAPQLNEFVPAYPVPPGQSGKPYRDGWDVVRATEQGMARSVWVYRSVKAISDNQAKLPMIMRAGTRWTGKLVDHPLLDKFNFTTSPYESALIWRKRLSMQLLLNRQGVMIEVIRSRMGTVLALYLLPAGYTWPIPDEQVFVKAFRVQMPGKAWFDVEAKNVIWIREPHPTDPYSGMTPLEAAGLSVETDWYARMYQRNFLVNDGRPGGLLVVKGEIDTTDAEELRTRFQGPVGNGYNAAGRIAVIEGEDGADFIDLATAPRDAQYAETRHDMKEETLGAFGVPESIALANTSDRTFSNADAELEVFWRETMLNHLGTIASGLDALDPAPRMFVGFDLRQVEVLERHMRERRKFSLQEVQANVLTVDEYRDETGRPPVGQGAAKLYQPVNMFPVVDTTAPSVPPLTDPDPNEWFPSATQASLVTRRGPQFKVALTDAEMKAAQHQGVMVNVAIPPELAEELALETGEPAEQLHVTLAYLGKANQFTPARIAALRAAVAAFCAGAPPMTAEVRGYGRFPASTSSDGLDVVWAHMDAPGLTELRTRLVAALRAAGFEPRTTHGFTPHITLAYVDPASTTPHVTAQGRFAIDHLQVTVSNRSSDHSLQAGAVGFKNLDAPPTEGMVPKALAPLGRG